MNHLLRAEFARAWPVLRDCGRRAEQLFVGFFWNISQSIARDNHEDGEVSLLWMFYFQRIKTEQSLSLKCSVDKNDGRTARACLGFWLKKIGKKESLGCRMILLIRSAEILHLQHPREKANQRPNRHRVCPFLLLLLLRGYSSCVRVCLFWGGLSSIIASRVLFASLIIIIIIIIVIIN